MFEDIIRYTNEEESAKMLNFVAELGMKEIALVFSKHSDKNKEIAETLGKKSAVRVRLGLEVKAKDAQKYSAKYDALFSLATRDAIENKFITHLYGAEELEDKDKTHRRGSGLNHVLVKLMAEKKKKYCFDLSSVLMSKEKGRVLGRMMQNKKFFFRNLRSHTLAKHSKNKFQIIHVISKVSFRWLW